VVQSLTEVAWRMKTLLTRRWNRGTEKRTQNSKRKMLSSAKASKSNRLSGRSKSLRKINSKGKWNKRKHTKLPKSNKKLMRGML